MVDTAAALRAQTGGGVLGPCGGRGPPGPVGRCMRHRAAEAQPLGHIGHGWTPMRVIHVCEPGQGAQGGWGAGGCAGRKAQWLGCGEGEGRRSAGCHYGMRRRIPRMPAVSKHARRRATSCACTDFACKAQPRTTAPLPFWRQNVVLVPLQPVTCASSSSSPPG